MRDHQLAPAVSAVRSGAWPAWCGKEVRGPPTSTLGATAGTMLLLVAVAKQLLLCSCFTVFLKGEVVAESPESAGSLDYHSVRLQMKDALLTA